MDNGSVDAAPSPRIAMVLSGGGARGAYEAGVISYLLDELPKRLGRPIPVNILTGTSVGAVHACFVAGAMGEPDAGARLIKIWESLTLENAFDIGVDDVFGLPFKLLGLFRSSVLKPASPQAPDRLPGLLDTRGLESIVIGSVSWHRLRDNVDSGRISAVAVAATEIATGRTVVFVDTPSGKVDNWARDRFVVARPAKLKPAHALASAALPLVFPAVRVKQTYYCDGGLRLNTPLAPALRLGAERVLLVGLRRQMRPGEEEKLATKREASYTSATYLAGKALNALLLDRVEYDLNQMRLFNAILEDGVKAYGEEFLTRINETIVAHRATPYRIVRDVFLRPSEDLGMIASDCLAHKPRGAGVRGWISRRMAQFAAKGTLEEADLLSYLFFDRCYTEHLVELGRKDAAEAADELVAFFS